MYTKEELEIVDYIENENPSSVANVADKLHKYITGQLVDKGRIA